MTWRKRVKRGAKSPTAALHGRDDFQHLVAE